MKRRAVSIRSQDGLCLRGYYYEQKQGAPIEVMFHGYRGTAERDMSGAVYRCFSLGRNALIVDHRASGTSDGHVITFGAKEQYDCRAWVDFVVREIDPHAKIILTGISMGAATVMLASALPMPPNVVGVLADCGYTSAKEIIYKVARDMHLPPALLYPFARLGARLLGGFDPDDASPVRAMAECRLPIIFFHGDADGFVPCEMSRENFDACASKQKRLVITPNAAHGLCFSTDQESYFAALREFFDPILQENTDVSLLN